MSLNINLSSWKVTLKLPHFTLAIIFALFVSANRVDATLCDPNNSSTCAFGGTCRAFPSTSGSEMPHVCTCPVFDCTREGFHPVCDVDGRTHLNDACRRQAECAQQKRIIPFCTGTCGDPSCIEIPNIFQPCSADRNKCLNNGECLLDVNDRAFCNCLSNFQGSRCETVLAETKATITPDGCRVTSAGFDYRIAFLCMLGLLGLVLLLQITYCVIKCHSRRKQSFDYGDEISPESMPQDGEKTELPVSPHYNSHGSITKSATVEIGV